MRAWLAALFCLVLSACHYSPKDWRTEQVDPDLQERTLWEVCLDRETGSYTIPSDVPPHAARCAAPEAIKYRTPIRVGYRGKNLAHVGTARLAVVQWNVWLDWPGFLVYDPVDPDIELVWEESVLYLGLAEPHYTPGAGWNCTAHVYTAGTESGKVALHEMGHCLGLSHDGNVTVPNDYEVFCSVMKQGLTCLDYGLTDADKVALWELYDE